MTRVPLVIGLLGLILWTGGAVSAESARTTRTDSGVTGRQTPDDLPSSLDQKLNQILQNQQALLEKLEAVMEELRIIKVRSTR